MRYISVFFQTMIGYLFGAGVVSRPGRRIIGGILGCGCLVLILGMAALTLYSILDFHGRI